MHAHPTRTLLLFLGLISLAIGFVYALFVFTGGTLFRPAPQTASQATGFPADAPAPTPQDYVTAQKGFQYLVSYSGNGFMPETLSVKKDETVRFTNNSDDSLRLSLESAQVTSLNHAEYYEYTFANAGTLVYSDGTNKVVVTVK
ncbi:MAG: hypothetical protein AAB480_00690 [Patescibacteria group bacterium]